MKLEELGRLCVGKTWNAKVQFEELMVDVFVQCLKKDEGLRAKVEASIMEAAHKYFDAKLRVQP